MSKYVKGFIACLILILVMGATTYRGDSLRTDSYGWELMGQTATAESASPVQRDYATFVSDNTNSIIKTFTPYRYNNIGMRFIVDNPDTTGATIDVFASKGQDYFNRVMTLAVTGGTASGPDTSTDSSAVFCDTITVTNSNWITAVTAVDNGGNNRQASVWLDANGYDTWAFVPTTVSGTTTVRVEVTGH